MSTETKPPLTLPIEAGKKYVDSDGLLWLCRVSDMPKPWPHLCTSGELHARFNDEGACATSMRRLRHDYAEPAPRVLRAWRPEEVPLGALIQYHAWRTCERTMISAAFLDGICTGHAKEEVKYEALKAYWKHSTDNGATWGPCGVWEGGGE